MGFDKVLSFFDIQTKWERFLRTLLKISRKCDVETPTTRDAVLQGAVFYTII